MKRFSIVLIVVFIAIWSPMSGQESQLYPYRHENFKRPDTNVIVGHFTEALDASRFPDASFVGVYMMVDSNYHHSVDDLLSGVQSYFSHYNIPAIFVKQPKPLPSNGASLRLFINGDAFRGDLSIGNISMFELKDNHADLFARIKKSYTEANGDQIKN